MCRALNPDTMGSLCCSLLLSSLDLIMSHITLSNDIGKLLLQSCHVVLGRKLQECNLLLQSFLVLYQARTASGVKSAGLGACQHFQVYYVQPPTFPDAKVSYPEAKCYHIVSIHIWRLAQDARIMSLADSLTPYALISNQARLANSTVAETVMHPQGCMSSPSTAPALVSCTCLCWDLCQNSGG